MVQVSLCDNFGVFCLYKRLVLDVMFANAEEELFSKESSVNLEYRVDDQCDVSVGGKWTEEDAEIIPYRRILFVSADKFPLIVQRVQEFVS